MKCLLRSLWVCAFTFSGWLPLAAQKTEKTIQLATGARLQLKEFADPAVRQSILQSGENGRYVWVGSSQHKNAAYRAAANGELKVLARLGKDSYIFSSNKIPDAADAKRWGIETAAAYEPGLKLSPSLALRKIPGHAVSGSSIKLWVALWPDVAPAFCRQQLQAAGFQAPENEINAWGVFEITCPLQRLQALASLPAVAYIQPIPAPDRALNFASRGMSRAMGLNAPLADGGRNLRGAGVVVGVGDDSDPSLHPDLQDRVINHTPGLVNDHGAHVSGTVGGAGNILPTRAGYAPRARILNQWFSGVWQNAATYVQDYNMVVTNNSYANIVGECDLNGQYDLNSKLLDEQALSFPQLLHVFASGNDGDYTCSPYPQRYATVLSGLQSAKNIITTGRTDYVQFASSSSSSGPVKDGRLKPEIVALGEAIVSTIGNYSIGFPYWTAWGTSMAAPAVSGGLALLYERYRQLHANANPSGALMKALLLNGARDLGTAGPDFRHGYGMMHLESSLRMLENATYVLDNIGQSQTKEISITVPAGTHQLKVMLYWHDPAANVLATQTLVNDLDLEVVAPGGTTVLPLVLDASPSGVANTAVPGQDHTNNSEQVVITTPTPGTYTLRVRGFDVLVNAPQAYALVYDTLMNGIRISTPFTGESYYPASNPVYINWDYYGDGTNTFTLDYSIDDGATWTNMASAIPATQRWYEWYSPNTNTTLARIRITRNGTGETFTTGRFSLINAPFPNLAPLAEQCEGYLKMNWTAVAGVDGYEILLKRNGEMTPIDSVGPAVTTYTISGLPSDSLQYASVRSIFQGKRSRWINTVERLPNNGSCTGAISNNDLKLDSITAPVTGRAFTSSALSASTTMQVRIRNLDDNPVNSFNVAYSINGSPFVVQSVSTTIPALGTYVHAIPSLDFSATGTYSVTAVVTNTSGADPFPLNDTLRMNIRHLANPVVSLTTPLMDGFENAEIATLSRGQRGMAGTERWDVLFSDPFSRLRTRAFATAPRSGQRAVTLDVSKSTPRAVNPVNYLMGTFNMSGYTTADEVRLDFWMKQHGITQGSHPQNKVWVRGSEANAWIEVLDFGSSQPPVPGQFARSRSLEISKALQTAGQSFSTSTQIRFGQFALYAAADDRRFGGLSFDDVQLYLAANDVQMVAIDTPYLLSCGLGPNVPIRIRVRNSMNAALTNVPVSYRINAGPIVTENISAIPANSTIAYTFSATANLSASGAYTLQAWTALPGDNVASNDSAVAAVNNQPVIAAFPYLQNFESGAANWYASGTNSSWEFGTPASQKITGAASGTNAWKTRLTGNYSDNERSYLYSPCFNINALTAPMLSFSMAYDMEDCSPFGVVCDAAWVEYSYNGITWTKLGSFGAGTNWYDYSPAQVWMSSNQVHWHVASIPLPKQPGDLRLRFVLFSDDATNREGVVLDDIHIFDNTTPIYSSLSNSNAVSQPVAGTNWIHFTDGGNILASLQPNGNDLGNTELRTWINAGPIRNDGNQYFANRNITVKPAQPVGANPVKVRFYFTDEEVDEMRNALGCGSCTNPRDFTKLNVSKYTNTNKTLEDGSLTNNTGGTWRTIANSSIQFVPNEKGYYAEFDVSDFSEQWLTDGGYNIPLPATWVSFVAQKRNENLALLSWTTANENLVLNYTLERAAPGASTFEPVATLAAQNQSLAEYSVSDEVSGRRGTYLYRVKRTDRDGNISYSAIRSLRFAQRSIVASISPNPARQFAWVQLDIAEAKSVNWRLTDGSGRALMQGKWILTEGVQKLRLDIEKLSSGIYYLQLNDGNEVQTLTLNKLN